MSEALVEGIAAGRIIDLNIVKLLDAELPTEFEDVAAVDPGHRAALIPVIGDAADLARRQLAGAAHAVELQPWIGVELLLHRQRCGEPDGGYIESVRVRNPVIPEARKRRPELADQFG